METNLAEIRRLLEETQGRLRELEGGSKEGEEEEEEREAELRKVQAEARKLKKDKKSLEQMLEEYRREEKRVPWNVDTLSTEGFSKVSQQSPDSLSLVFRFHILSFPECFQHKANIKRGGNGGGKGGEA